MAFFYEEMALLILAKNFGNSRTVCELLKLVSDLSKRGHFLKQIWSQMIQNDLKPGENIQLAC